ncbi:MAG: hypothetical protein ACYTG7_04470 [Planctomycetota bacterium]|jgi:hypothetical protein
MRHRQQRGTLHTACPSAQPPRTSFIIGNKYIAVTLIVLSVILIVISFQVHHKVYFEAVKESWLDIFEEHSEFDMTKYSTFSGVELFKDRLFFTFDPLKGDQKIKCPT